MTIAINIDVVAVLEVCATTRSEAHPSIYRHRRYSVPASSAGTRHGMTSNSCLAPHGARERMPRGASPTMFTSGQRGVQTLSKACSSSTTMMGS
jgi:hypothetical protein